MNLRFHCLLFALGSVALLGMPSPAIADRQKPVVLVNGIQQQLPTGSTLGTSAPTADAASLNLPHGAPPRAPNNGDVWTTSDGLYVRANGVTEGPFKTSKFRSDKVLIGPNPKDSEELLNIAGSVTAPRTVAVGVGGGFISEGIMLRTGAGTFTNTAPTPTSTDNIYKGVFATNSMNAITLAADNPMGYLGATTLYISSPPNAASDVASYTAANKNNLFIARNGTGRPNLYSIYSANGRVGLFASIATPGSPQNAGGLLISTTQSIPQWGTQAPYLHVTGSRLQDYGNYNTGTGVIDAYVGGETVSGDTATTEFDAPQLDANCPGTCTGGVTYAKAATLRISGAPVPYTASSASFVGSISGNVLTVSSISSGKIIVGQGQYISGAGVPAGTTVMNLLSGIGYTGTYLLNNTLDTPVPSTNMTATAGCGCVTITKPYALQVATGNTFLGGTLEIKQGSNPLSGTGWGANGLRLSTDAAAITDTKSSGIVPLEAIYALRKDSFYGMGANITNLAEFYVEDDPYVGTGTVGNSWAIYNGGSMYVGRNQTINGNLTTNGSVTAGSASVTGAVSIGGNLAASAATFSGNLTGTSGYFSGNLTGGSATINGAATVSGIATVGGLNSPSATIAGTLNAQSAIVTGDISTNGNINSYGAAGLSANAATIGGPISAINGSFSGNVSVSGTLTGYGASLNGNVAITGNASIGAGARSLAAWGTNGAKVSSGAATFTDTSSSGTVASAFSNAFAADTLTATSATTYTNAGTVYIGGPPSAGTNVAITNAWALYVASGNTLLTGGLKIGGSRSLPAWGTAGPELQIPTGVTLTDTSSSGTVASAHANTIGQATFAATSATTYTNAATLYIQNAPTAGTNVTITRGWGIYNASNNYVGGSLSVGTTVQSGAGTVNATGGYYANGVAGFTGTKVAGTCTFNISGGIITSVTGC